MALRQPYAQNVLEPLVKERDKYRLPIFLAAVSVLGAIALGFSTRWGIGVSPDSVVYIAVARNLLSGKGLSVSVDREQFAPLTHYPPLYPTVLAGIGIFGIDPSDGARWLGALLLAANITLLGAAVYFATRSFWLSVCGSFLMVSSFPMAQIHTMAWAEPLFIFLELFGVMLLALYFERPRYFLLIASSSAMGLGFMARYAGIALLVTGLMGTLLLGKKGGTKRFVDAGLYSAIGCFPIAFWLVRNLSIAGTATNRKLVLHPPTSEHLQAMVDAFSVWLFPATTFPVTGWVSLFLVLVLVISALVLAQREVSRLNQGPPCLISGIPLLLSIFMLSYGLLLLISISFFDAYTPIDTRILSPLYPATLVVALSVVSRLLIAVPGRATRLALVMLGIAISFSQLGGTISWLKLSYHSGIGYASQGWKESKLIKRVNSLAASRPVFTNAADAVYLLTGRPAYAIPAKVDPKTKLVDRNYASELAAMEVEIRQKSGILVYFSRVGWRRHLPSEDELLDRLALQLMAREEDGSIYQLVEAEKAGSAN